ncbi:MAG: crossover junction endodeoxyribonuclease RuvC [Candidatus Omnitrophica bacterium]|nr:crossover junction endodeoxyribonuclease RuvC [Candidatus Omnitrophota bacterium]
MVILGVDPALSVTGYGAIDAGRNNIFLLEAGVITTPPQEALPQRLDKIFRGVTKLISDTKPAVLVLEKLYAHYRHPTTAYLLGHARGVICLACSRQNVAMVEYAATRVKKAVVGRGQASKEQVQRMVLNFLKVDVVPKYTDVTDALALALAHSNIIKAAKIAAKDLRRA